MMVRALLLHDDDAHVDACQRKQRCGLKARERLNVGE